MNKDVCMSEMTWEEEWVSTPNSLPLPEMIFIDGEVFHSDGVTPLVITDLDYQRGGYRRRGRWVSPWRYED